MVLGSGHEAVELEGEELERQKKDWKGYQNGLVRLMPGRWLFPKDFTKFADKYSSFEFRPTDVVVMTWPKCGTTWTQEIVWTMRNNPNLDHPMANLPTMARSPFLEFDAIIGHEPAGSMLEAFNKMCPGRDPANGVFLQMAECMADPRTIKTHLPFSLITPTVLDTSKVVAVFRNPKDLAISYHHHCRLINSHGYVGTFEEFVQYYIDDDLMFGPYWLHLKEVWERRGHKNLHIMYYEDMKADIMSELRKLDKFLNTKLTDEQLLNVVKHTGFGEMKTRAESMLKEKAEKKPGEDEKPVEPGFNMEVMKKDGGFFRKGQAGDWKGKVSGEMEAKLDAWIAKNITTLGITFNFE